MPGPGDHVSVDEFIDSIADVQRREDAREICALMSAETGERPAMRGSSIIGFGDAAGGEWMAVGFSPRKPAQVIYLESTERHADLLSRLGPHRAGKGCVYIKRLSQVDEAVLRELVRLAYAAAR